MHIFFNSLYYQFIAKGQPIQFFANSEPLTSHPNTTNTPNCQSNHETNMMFAWWLVSPLKADAGTLWAVGLSDTDNLIRLLSHIGEIHNRTGNHDRHLFLTGSHSLLSSIKRQEGYLPVGIQLNSFSVTRSMIFLQG